MQRKDGPPVELLAQPARDGTTIALPPIGTNTPDGSASGMKLHLPFGGGNLVIDSIKERVLKRYPQSC